jgi:hypothetical protein
VGIRKRPAAFAGKVIDKRRQNEDESSFEDYFVDQDEEKIPV